MKLNIISTMAATHAKRKRRDQRAQKSAIKTTCLNTNAPWNLEPLRSVSFTLLLGAVAAAALFAMPGTICGQIYVTDFTTSSVGVYNASTGGAINGWSSGLSNPFGIAVSGGNVFVTNDGNNKISEYTITGLPVNASLVSNLNSPIGIDVFGGNLYVVNSSGGTIGEYNALTGLAVNTQLVTGLSSPWGIDVSEGKIFVVNTGTFTIGEYDATTGVAVNSSLVHLNSPYALEVSEGNIFATYTHSIGEYDATTGTAINASLVTGLANPFGIEVVVPEPATWAVALLVTLACGIQLARRRPLGGKSWRQ